LTAEIWSDIGVSPPTTSRGSLGSGITSSEFSEEVSSLPVTIYAQAQATGKSKSDIYSVYINS
jgi:hypothetical protein